MFFRKSKKRDYEEEIRRLQAKLSDALWDNVTLRSDIQELHEYPSTDDELPFSALDEEEKSETDITYFVDRIDYLKEELEKLGDAHQLDLITINQLQVALDVIVDKYERLRKQKGLA